MATRINPDAVVVDHGPVFRVIPWTDAGRAWVDRYIGEEAQTFGPGFVVEPRYLQTIVRGMQACGLLLVSEGRGGKGRGHQEQGTAGSPSLGCRPGVVRSAIGGTKGGTTWLKPQASTWESS